MGRLIRGIACVFLFAAGAVAQYAPPGGGGGTGDMVAAQYVPSGTGAPPNPCATAGAQYRNTSTTPYDFYYCPSAGGNWLGPVSFGASSMVYPGAGVPNSTGSAWGTSYTVGTGASNLVQLNGSSQLPAVSAALLTNIPADASKVSTSTTVNGHALSGNVSVTATDVGLGSVNNTADTAKPVSTAQQTALDLKANIASPSFTGAVVDSGSLTLSGTLTPTALSGDVNDYNPTNCSTALALRIDGGAADRNITGLACGTPADGRIIDIVNVGTTNALVFVNQSSSSTAANRFLLPADTTIPINTALAIRYDGTSSRWRPWSRALSNTGVAAGTYTSVTVDVAGRVTAGTNPTVPLVSGTTASPTGPNNYVICTSTCTVTVPVPAAGSQLCVRNGMNVSTVITLSAIGSSAMYEKTDSTAYGTPGTGTMVSGGAVGDKVCIVGLDATHYLTLSYNGTWTAN